MKLNNYLRPDTLGRIQFRQELPVVLHLDYGVQ
jgi:hypothetical protein